MADRIKGITIEIGGNTTKLTEALAKVNTSLSASQRALRDVNKLLKFDSTNVTLLKQKQDYLKQSVEDCKQKLQQEKDALAQLRASDTTGETTEQQRALERQIAETEGQLKSLENQLKSFGSVGAQQVAAVGEKMKDLGGKMEAAGKTLTTHLTVPIAGILGAGTKSALSYGDSIAKVATIMDKSQMSVSDMHDQILDLSDATGKGASELAEAAYQAISASVNTADAVGFVSTATKLAKAGFLESADAVDVLTTIINAYGYSASDAEKIADELVQTQNKGKTTVKELASAMGTVIPTAAALNIPLEQLNTSYVIMTKQGINTANATTYLNGMFTELADGGSTVSEILREKTGKSFGELMASGENLGGVLNILYESTGKNSEEFLNLWGNTRAARGALALANGDADEFNTTLQEMYESTGNVSSALEDLDTPAANLRKSLNRLQNEGERLGEILIPVVDRIADGIQTLMDKWDQLDPKTKTTITNAMLIAAIVGPVLTLVGGLVTNVGMLLTYAPAVAGAWSAAAPVVGGAFAAIAPALLPIVGVAAVVIATADEIKRNYGDLPTFMDSCKTELQGTWDSICEYFRGVGDRWGETIDRIKGAQDDNASHDAQIWAQIRGNIEQSVGGILQTVQTGWSTIQSATGTAWANVQSTVQQHGGGIQGVIKACMDGSLSIWTVGYDLINGVTGGKLDAVAGTVGEKLEAVREKFREKMDAASEAVRTAIEKIKGFFKFDWQLPHLKLPHISISGKFSLNPPSVPSFGIQWYKKAMNNGMILTNPTIFGMQNGRFLGGGEAGAEAVVGVGSLRSMIRESVQDAGGGGNTYYFGDVVINGAGKNTEQIAREFWDMVRKKVP